MITPDLFAIIRRAAMRAVTKYDVTVLVLRDVLGFHADEVAEMLD